MVMRTDGTMNKALFGLLIVSMLLGSGGCGENAARLNDRARKAFMAGDQAEAARLFNRTLTLDPDNAEAHFYLGWIYRMQGKADEAITELKKALAADPDHELAYRNLGDLYLERGMLADAIDAFNRAIAINPYAGMAYYGLSIAYKQQGALTKAADALFEAGLLAVVSSNKDLASNAYKNLLESGNTQLAFELQGVLSPWFDPANEVVTQSQGSRSPR
jgi:tetratricopeptide (TPR) repeat protein